MRSIKLNSKIRRLIPINVLAAVVLLFSCTAKSSNQHMSSGFGADSVNTTVDNAERDEPGGNVKAMINGVSYVAPSRKPVKNDFIIQKAHNASYTAITPYSFYDWSQNKFTFNSSRQWWGERSVGCVKSIQDAHSAGLKVMLKPHVWVKKDGWCGDLTFDSVRLWQPFADSYEKYILHYALIADSMDVDMLCIGVEFRETAVLHSDYFRDLISKIRKVYKGKVVYASNWDYYDKIEFWDALDFIGVDAYFPVCQLDIPTQKTLKKGWGPIKEKLRLFSEKYDKKMLFTEYGYRSKSKCAGNQWELDDNWNYKNNANLEAQKQAYQGLYENFWKEDWFMGGFAWKWYSNHANAGGENDSDFTPQNKPAAEVMKKYYAMFR